MNLPWATDFRHDWIRESVLIFGAINREHIVVKFRVSIPQASTDLRETQKKWSLLMTYDKSAKRYVKMVRS